MDAFLSYLNNKPKFRDRLIVSESPFPVVLVWSSFENLPTISGVTVVMRSDFSLDDFENTSEAIKILKKEFHNKLPFLTIKYNTNATQFDIDGTLYNESEAAIFISSALNIKLGHNPAKKPNDASQISDAFHTWSRTVFDGIEVRKVDIDAIILSKDYSSISTIIEIKRSAKNPVGQWRPYMQPHGKNTDYWNYILCFTLCKILSCDFVTIHHEIISNDLEFDDETKVDTFVFKKNTVISNETIDAFQSEKNRKIFKASRF